MDFFRKFVYVTILVIERIHRRTVNNEENSRLNGPSLHSRFTNSFVAGSFHVVIAAYTVAHAILARSVRQISQALVVIDAREVDSFGL